MASHVCDVVSRSYGADSVESGADDSAYMLRRELLPDEALAWYRRGTPAALTDSEPARGCSDVAESPNPR
jgi:hypothetical protein